MSSLENKLTERAKKKNAKREEKRLAIALSSLSALQSLGYANTSLRDIASDAGLSLGTLHYYFEDKIELINYCIKVYKQLMVDRLYMSAVNAESRSAFIHNIASALTEAIETGNAHHRLWYDIRAQAMFDERFRPIKDEIEKELIESVELMLGVLGSQACPKITYAQLDGVFRYFMQGKTEGRDLKREDILAEFSRIIDSL